MKKIMGFLLAAALMLALTGCGKAEAEQEQLTVYSFSGENNQLAVSNGVIVIDDKNQIFSGGDLKVIDDSFTDITSFIAEFYTITGSEKNIIISNSFSDMTGAAVNPPKDLGKASGGGIIGKQWTDDLKNNFFFELTAIDKNSEKTVYQLQLSLTEITKNANN